MSNNHLPKLDRHINELIMKFNVSLGFGAVKRQLKNNITGQQCIIAPPLAPPLGGLKIVPFYPIFLSSLTPHEVPP